jgi:hypothetical protein
MELLTKINNIFIDLIIDNNYQIDDTLEWKEQFVLYIMRYRRVIGTIILIILLLIMKYCKWEPNNVRDNIRNNSKQIGGGPAAAIVAAPAAAAVLGSGAAGAAGAAGASVAGSGGAAALASSAGASVAGSGGAAALASTVGQSVGSNAAKNLAQDALSNAKSGNGRSDSRKLMNIATGGKYSAMRNAGMNRFESGLELTRQGGQFVADKFKEFANWLYEILFAIAISIAICMIVVPSIAFFALGLICYFLLRKKISSMKAF